MSISNQLIKMQNETMKKYTKLLKSEALRLKDCIQNQIDNYYLSYTPKYYERTNKFKTSLMVEDFIEFDITNNRINMKLYFNPDLAWHESYFNDEGGYVPQLINDGWSWDNIITPNDHFSNFEGFHYIEKGISDFNRKNIYGIKINVINDWI